MHANMALQLCMQHSNIYSAQYSTLSNASSCPSCPSSCPLPPAPPPGPSHLPYPPASSHLPCLLPPPTCPASWPLPPTLPSCPLPPALPPDPSHLPSLLTPPTCMQNSSASTTCCTLPLMVHSSSMKESPSFDVRSESRSEALCAVCSMYSQRRFRGATAIMRKHAMALAPGSPKSVWAWQGRKDMSLTISGSFSAVQCRKVARFKLIQT